MVNYTPLNMFRASLHKDVDLHLPKKHLYEKFLFPLSLTVFLISLSVYVVINALNLQQVTKATREKNITKTAYSYQYSSLAEINFIPQIINKTQVDASKLLVQAKAFYPALKEKDLIKLINQRLFGLAALFEFNGKNLEKKLDNFSNIEKDFQALQEQYNKNVFAIDGFYFKVRFAGVFPENLKKLAKDEAELKVLAQSKLLDYLKKAQDYKNPSWLLTSFNQDKTILLLNNGELSVSFENYNLYPPLFDDPEFYSTISQSPLNKFSEIYILKTLNPMKKEYEEYAYVVYYLTKKAGSYFPLEKLITDFVKKSKIR